MSKKKKQKKKKIKKIKNKARNGFFYCKLKNNKKKCIIQGNEVKRWKKKN